MTQANLDPKTVRFEPRRFASTTAYYERYRLAYPQRLLTRVVALLGLEPGDPILDLGTGTGMLAIGFARLGMKVTAMDPEPNMLKMCEDNAKLAGVQLSLERASSYDLTADMGPFKLVTMGRSFHWMDRLATLAMLAQIITDDGAVAFFHDTHPPVPENNWFKVMRDIQDRFGPSQASHGTERRGGHTRYEPYLFQTGFTEIDGLSVTVRQKVTIEDLVGRAFSMSTTSPERLGDRAQAFVNQLSAALQELSADGTFLEIAELVAVLARRPAKDGQRGQYA